MSSTLTSFQTITSNLSRWQDITAKKPAVATATAYYQQNIGNVKSADDLLGNYRLFSYAMTAFGLGDMIYAKGMMRKVLDGGITDSKSYANSLTDPRFKAFAAAFDFQSKGTAVTASAAATTDVVTAYVQQTTEVDAGQLNEGVRLALYFQRNAAKITSGYSILADKAFLTVVQTALGISPQSSQQDIATQAQVITSKLNLADLKDPAKLQKFLQKFAVMYDINNASTQPTPPAVTLLSGQAGGASISGDLLMSMQKLKRGGF